MIRKLYILLVLMLAFQLKVLPQKTLSDTIFIVKEIQKDGIYHAIYIEPDRSSKYYDRINNFKLDLNAYQESLKQLTGNKPAKLAKHKTPIIPKKWLELHAYKNKYYVYSPSDYGSNSRLKITDTTLIWQGMELGANVINSVQTIDQNTVEFSITKFALSQISGKFIKVKSKLFIHIIDRQNQIAVFEFITKSAPVRYELRVSADKVRNFPLIVNYCEDQKQMELSFDSVDFKKMLQMN